jgi:hypothetical protein
MMKKIPNTKPTKKANVTNQKLSDVPFKTAKALKDAQDQIQLQVWRRLEEAKVLNEMLTQKQYSFWHDEFAKGLVCSYVEENDMSLVRVTSEGGGIKININKALAITAPLGESVLTQLVRAMSESFAMTYYKAKGMLPNDVAKKHETDI